MPGSDSGWQETWIPPGCSRRRTTQDDLRAWLAALCSDDAQVREAALHETSCANSLEMLIEAAQLEVLYEELPNVVTDALEEQATWNVFKVKDRDQPPGHNGQQAPQGTVPVSMALMPPAGISGHPVDRSIPWSPSRRRRASPRM